MSDQGEEELFGDVTVEQGDFVTRKVQSEGRINIPEGYLRHAGIGEDDNIAVVADGDSLKIMKASWDEIQGMIGGKDER